MIQLSLKKLLGNFTLDIQTTIESESFVALYGASGSGKTSFLRILAGLEHSEGEIVVSGEVWQNQNTFLPPQKRNIGFVFQEYALFENMTPLHNLLYVNKDKVLAQKLLEMTELSPLKHRAITTLSGGQKQRLALARALMRRPTLLLLDEPLSALDPTMRHILQNEIALLHKEFHTTTLMVSHDPSEIYKLAQRVLVLQNGRVIQEGSPREVFLHTSGSAKFSFQGEILDIYKTDAIHVATVAIGQQIVEVVLGTLEAQGLKTGDTVTLSSKAFNPVIRKT